LTDENYKLELLEDSILAGIDAMALVESPAIEDGFFAFAAEKFAETYTDYPQAAIDAAKQGIKRNEETGNKCATQVGKVRAQQLANREPVSLDTVRRMRAFLIRQKDNYELARDRKDYNACGYISYLLWGGPAALSWAEKTLRQAGEEFVKDEFEGLEDACQAGYIAYGLKRKRGRLVPNCVPKQKFANLVVEDIIKLELQKMSTLVPHYTKDGELYEGPTHRQGDRLMTGAVHTEDSEFLYHIEELSLDVSALPNYLNEPTGKLTVNKEASYGFAALEDQQMLIGPAMVPGKLIPRKDENGDVYYVYFTKDTIKKLAYKAMKDKIIDRVNIEHNSGELVDDVYLVESWIVENPQTDKAREYGLNPVEGTWMVMYKVDNLGVWEGYVRPGLVRGFSIEGYFAEQTITQ
jgi:hypothetical protein